MIKYRVEIVAIPDTKDEALSLYDELKKHEEVLSVSAASVGSEDLWKVSFETELGEDDRTIDELQQFVDKLKEAHGKVASPDEK